MIEFKNPPVVECWISFEFDPNENKREWDLELVGQYAQQYSKELPTLNAVHARQIQVQETSPTDLPKVVGQQVRLQMARLRNEAGSRVLQLGDDQLSWHVLKTAEEYPRYPTVRDEAQEKLETYIRIFQPRDVRSAALHYLDIITIPWPENKKIEMADYFVRSADLPEKPFGGTAAISYQFEVNCPIDAGPLLLQLQSIPVVQGDRAFRFRMEWHKQASAVNTLQSSEIWRRMDIVHQYMTECFLASLTKRTLDFFGPVGET
jgi:uncharacterized protein (TIGR04255 family)